jgi:hypothetical protein
LILIDDVGFGQFSTFGGGVPSPRWTSSQPRACATTGSTRLRCAARRALPLSPVEITTPLPPVSSARRPPDTTATHPCCREALGRSAKSFARTVT